jgi:proline iminopeptidase
LYPDGWEKYVAAIPETERGDMMAAYHRRLTSDDPGVRVAAARAWSVWEASASFLNQNPDYMAEAAGDTFALAFAGIENHYFVHGGFFERDDELLQGAHRLNDIPGVIVQGRHDVVCPMRSAWDLHRAWPQAKLEIIPDAGHSAFEPGTIDGLIRATDGFRTQAD